MPDTTPSLDMMRRMGLTVPPQSDSSGAKIPDAQVTNQQSTDPIWKQYAQMGIDALGGGVKGLLGFNPSPEASNSEYVGNALAQLGGATKGVVDAGLPFLAMTKGAPVFHGTGRVFEKFNPALNDTSDTLGYMTHFAEDPKYAASYSGAGDSWAKSGDRPNPNMLAAHLDAKNVLDLINPNMDDLSQFVASMDSTRKKSLIGAYKAARGYSNPENATRYLADNVEFALANRGIIDKTPFDAVKYSDAGRPAYAVPATTPITTPWGLPLNDTPQSLKILRSDKGYGGVSTVADDRWANTPRSLPDVPTPEKYKFDPTKNVKLGKTIQINSNTGPVKNSPYNIPEPTVNIKGYGNLTKTEAGHLVNGGELSMSDYYKAFSK